MDVATTTASARLELPMDAAETSAITSTLERSRQSLRDPPSRRVLLRKLGALICTNAWTRSQSPLCWQGKPLIGGEGYRAILHDVHRRHPARGQELPPGRDDRPRRREFRCCPNQFTLRPGRSFQRAQDLENACRFIAALWDVA